MNSAPVVKTWLFRSESSAGRVYQTLQRQDGSTSCDCPGWTKRVARDGSRTCKHVRLVALGLADEHAERFTGSGLPAPAPAARPVQPSSGRKLGRAFDFSE